MDYGIIIFSHFLPLILGFLSFLLSINGIMDDQKSVTVLGIAIILLAAFGPFIILPVYLGI